MVRLRKTKTKEPSKLGKEQDQTSRDVGCGMRDRIIGKKIVSPTSSTVTDKQKRVFNKDLKIVSLI